MRWVGYAPGALLLAALAGAACGRNQPQSPQEEAGLQDRPDAVTIQTLTTDDDEDAEALKHLSREGSDLSKVTDVRWYVYVPDEKAAVALAAGARTLGYEVDVRTSETQRLCICARNAVPTLERIRAMEQELDALATPLKGYVDGWEAAVQR